MAFRYLLIKEVKDFLRDPRIMIPFIISALILPIMGIVVQSGMQQTMQVVQKPITSFALINLDKGPYGALIVELLKQYEEALRAQGRSITIEIVKSVSEAVKKSEITVVIPSSFSQEFELYLQGNRSEPPRIVVIQSVKSIGMGVEFARASVAASMIQDLLKAYVVRKFNVSRGVFNALQRPLNWFTAAYIVPRHSFLVTMTPSVFTSISMAMVVLPLIIGIIGVTILQMSATSMALENEVRTLETLLTFPIPRHHILFAKIGGALIVGIIGSLLNLAGLALYIHIVSTSTAEIVKIGAQTPSTQFVVEVLRKLGIENIVSPTQLITPSISYIAILGVSALILVLTLATLGVIIGALSSDVRIANTFVGPISMPIFVFAYMAAFMDPLTLAPSARLALLSIPFTQTCLLAKLALLNLYVPELPLGIAISITVPVILTIVTARMLSIETLTRVQYTLSRAFRKRREGV